MRRIDETDTTQALKLLMQDHRRIRRMLKHAEDAGSEPLVQARAADLACRALEEHGDTEERLLYPVLRSLDGAAGIDDARREHQVARDLIAALDRLGPADGQFLPTLRELGAWIDEHVRTEEETLLTRASEAALDLAPLAHALLERQRSGAITDVDVDAELAADALEDALPRALDDARDDGAEDRQRLRVPGRRGAH
jgi:Hemerythrin HHE cation binding domain